MRANRHRAQGAERRARAQNRGLPISRPVCGARNVQFLLLVYIDPARLDAVPQDVFDADMRHCFEQADELKRKGTLLGSQQLEAPETARTVRSRKGQGTVTDGPFAETKEMLAGFNLIEAASMEDAVKLAQTFPWTSYGSVEVRPVRDMAAVRARVGAQADVAGNP
jgi:hypothetical protein